MFSARYSSQGTYPPTFPAVEHLRELLDEWRRRRGQHTRTVQQAQVISGRTFCRRTRSDGTCHADHSQALALVSTTSRRYALRVVAGCAPIGATITGALTIAGLTADSRGGAAAGSRRTDRPGFCPCDRGATRQGPSDARQPGERRSRSSRLRDVRSTVYSPGRGRRDRLRTAVAGSGARRAVDLGRHGPLSRWTSGGRPPESRHRPAPPRGDALPGGRPVRYTMTAR
jgi:hypothetical protein